MNVINPIEIAYMKEWEWSPISCFLSMHITLSETIYVKISQFIFEQVNGMTCSTYQMWGEKHLLNLNKACDIILLISNTIIVSDLLIAVEITY